MIAFCVSHPFREREVTIDAIQLCTAGHNVLSHSWCIFWDSLSKAGYQEHHVEKLGVKRREPVEGTGLAWGRLEMVQMAVHSEIWPANSGWQVKSRWGFETLWMTEHWDEMIQGKAAPGASQHSRLKCVSSDAHLHVCEQAVIHQWKTQRELWVLGGGGSLATCFCGFQTRQWSFSFLRELP